MSVLIKSMKKLPKDCPFCEMAHWNRLDGITGCEVVVGKRYVDETDDEFWKSDKRPSWCPLVEVPTPHGRLIDADDVLTQTQKGKCKNSFEMGKEYGWNKAIEYVGNFAPTVIEAEEDDEQVY